MKELSVVLKLAAPVFLLIGLLHLALGPAADILLGAQLSAEALADPVLDSQNRFYGVIFSIYGFLLYLCATDLDRYAPVLYICLGVFFAGGVARLVSIAFVGLPSALVLVLMAAELLIPPVLMVWHRRARTG